MIKKIELDFEGVRVKFRYGLGFLGSLVERTGYDIEEINNQMQKNPFVFVPIMMEESAKYADYRNGEDHKRTHLDFIDLLDECGGMISEQFIFFINGFTDSLTKGVPKRDPSKKDPPKKKKS